MGAVWIDWVSKRYLSLGNKLIREPRAKTTFKLTSRADVLIRVVHLEHQDFVPGLAAEIIPAVLPPARKWIHALAHILLSDKVGCEAVGHGHRRSIANGERAVLD